MVNGSVANYYGLDAVFGREPGLGYYGETEPWLSANSDLGEVKLIDISKYCDAKPCFLYFRLNANMNLDVNWDELIFVFITHMRGRCIKESWDYYQISSSDILERRAKL